MPPSIILHDVRLPSSLCCPAVFSRAAAALRTKAPSHGELWAVIK